MNENAVAARDVPSEPYEFNILRVFMDIND